ncbi:hypothetical protein C1634_005830 [Chryseobacterium viscerum]|uniref:Uncharacterized protein n=1 Tax=Chryseobacterium viscerum TaxID=1037377 RepID=A0A316WRS9_9FLAO|nr:hypothetical protein C1634_005830 [Chryseobacterium viscerum]
MEIFGQIRRTTKFQLRLKHGDTFALETEQNSRPGSLNKKDGKQWQCPLGKWSYVIETALSFRNFFLVVEENVCDIQRRVFLKGTGL